MTKFFEEKLEDFSPAAQPQNPPENPTRHEFLDPNPVAVPLKWNRQGSTLDEIRRATGLLSERMRQQGEETFEDADDFDIGEDVDDPVTIHELRGYASALTPTELYEQVFKKPYVPSPPLGPGTSNPPIPPDPEGNNPPIPVAPVAQ